MNKIYFKCFTLSLILPVVGTIIYIFISQGLDFTNFLWIFSIFIGGILGNFFMILGGITSEGSIIFLGFLGLFRYLFIYLFIYLFKIKSVKSYVFSIFYGFYTLIFGFVFFNAMMGI